MNVHRALLLAGLVAGVFASLTGAAGGARGSAIPCPGNGVVCTRISVPLDRTGHVPGTVSLYVQRLPAQGHERGVLFMVAGGPGQSATQAFDLAGQGFLYRLLFPGYTLVTFDVRGSGRSGSLHCPSLAAPALTELQYEQQVAACATSLGARRGLYTTDINADDIDAVRAHFGYRRIAVWGVSYGTKVALAFAHRHPHQTARLLLDSIVPLDSDHLYNTATLQAVAPNLGRYCATFDCSKATPNARADVVAVANRLQQHPLETSTRGPGGKNVHFYVNGLTVLSTVVEADLDPALAAELPAAIRAARIGRTAPLLRIVKLIGGGGGGGEGISNVLNLVTNCSDARLPWAATESLVRRQVTLGHDIANLPASAFGGFGAWAAQLGTAEQCLGWPGSAPARTTLAVTHEYPNVPVLALSGSFDMRTPTGQARAVVAQFPRGHLLVVRGAGHSVLTTATTICLIQAVHRWLADATPAASCGQPFKLAPLPAYPIQTAPAHRYSSARTLALAGTTLQEAETTWLMLTMEEETSARVAGLDGGTLKSSGRGLTLDRYSLTPGIAVTARLTEHAAAGKLTFAGAVTITGSAAAGGKLSLSDAGLAGKLGEQAVKGPIAPALTGRDASGGSSPTASDLARG